MIKTEQIDKGILGGLLLMAFSTCISVGLSNIAAALITVLLILRMMSNRTDFCWPEKEYNILFKAIGIFLVAMTLSAIAGGNFIFAWNKALFHFFYRPLPLLIIAVAVQQQKKIMAILNMAVISLVASDLVVIWRGLNGDLRAEGIAGGPMWMGSFLAILLPVMTIIVLNKKKFPKYQKSYQLFLGISLIALFFNGTRGVWLGMLIILPVLIMKYTKSWKKIIAIFLAFMVVFFSLWTCVPEVPLKIYSMFNIQQGGTKERILMWTSAVHMAQDSPLFGVGLGNYSEAYQTKYIMPEAKEPGQGHAHNNFMQMLGDTGIIGLTGFCIMFGSFIYWSWKRRENVFAVMALAATAGFLFHGLTEYNFGSSGSIKLFWLVFALCVKAALLDSKLADGKVEIK